MKKYEYDPTEISNLATPKSTVGGTNPRHAYWRMIDVRREARAPAIKLWSRQRQLAVCQVHRRLVTHLETSSLTTSWSQSFVPERHMSHVASSAVVVNHTSNRCNYSLLPRPTSYWRLNHSSCNIEMTWHRPKVVCCVKTNGTVLQKILDCGEWCVCGDDGVEAEAATSYDDIILSDRHTGQQRVASSTTWPTRDSEWRYSMAATDRRRNDVTFAAEPQCHGGQCVRWWRPSLATCIATTSDTWVKLYGCKVMKNIGVQSCWTIEP